MSAIGNKILSVLPVVEQIGEVALTIAKIFPATASIANIIEMGIKVEQGVRGEVPEIVQAFTDMQAVAAGGVKATDAEWTAWDSQVAEAHSGYLAAAAKIEAS